jgi:DNA-binding winged helix-turn-helix (wHTH) protein/tetratricopeptide (TPR) repeat protein
VLRFGTFEVDLRAGELRKQGVKIKLQEQPFQILTVLLQRPGELVSRDELRSQIWRMDTFVDFDNSLNTSMNKLREALGDSAESPRFIETVPRRGYRFLAPISSDGLKKGAIVGSGRRINPLATAVVFLLGTVIVGWLWHLSRASRLTEKDSIVLGDFTNNTGDPVFDGTLREGLSVQLEQSPFLSLVSEEGIHQTLGMMGQGANAKLTPSISREVCQRTNSKAVLDGSIALIGTRYSLILKAVNCGSGDSLASTEARADDKNHVLDALTNAASEMRRQLGETLSTVQKYDTPLEQATTSSLEALQALSLGGNAGDWASAIPFLQRAIELDPNFAMAYNQLANAYGAVGETVKAEENVRKAFELRGRMTEPEKLIVEAHYYRNITGNLLDARRSYALGEQIYPHESAFHRGVGLMDSNLGRYELSLNEYQTALRLRPRDSVIYRFVALTNLLLNRVDDAAATAREASAKGLDSALGPTVYAIAFLRNDTREMARQVAVAAGITGKEDLLLALEADTAAYFGHLAKARELTRLASTSAERAGGNEASAEYEAIAALRAGLCGNPDEAREQLSGARTRSSNGRDADYGLGLALAYSGNISGTQRLVDYFARTFPESTIVQFNYLPTLRARLALMYSNPQQAIHDLEIATPYEFGLPAIGFYNWPNLYPIYVRGEAYLAAHQGREAGAEFQKILDHRGIVLNEPIGALAHLQLGRAYALQGDAAKARTAYQNFLTLWSDADPDIPILKEAKAEYANLQ